MQKKRVSTILITRALTQKILTHHCVIQSTVNSEVLVNSFLVDTVKLKTTEDGLKSRIFHVSKKEYSLEGFITSDLQFSRDALKRHLTITKLLLRCVWYIFLQVAAGFVTEKSTFEKKTSSVVHRL